MSEFYTNKAFKLGLFGGVLIYIVIYARNFPPAFDGHCFDCYQISGFPFTSYESGTMLHLDRVLWLGEIGNILGAMLFIFAVGLFSDFIWSKILSHRAKLN